MKLKDGALQYASNGWKVFPIKPNAKNPPLAKWGTQSSDNPVQVTTWWDSTPNANIGLACGQSKIAAIDIDTKDGRRGKQTIELLELIHGHKFSPTRTQRTPSGGLQYFYRGEIPTTQNMIGRDLWPDGVSHIDTRGVGGSGGYVLLPPSVTARNDEQNTKAGMYEWINGANFPIAPLDQWLIDLFAAEALVGHNNAPQEFVVEPDADANIKWFDHYLEHDAPPAIQGEGGELRTLAVIGGVAKDRGISEDLALDMVYSSTWNSKCEPPWDYDELKTKIHNAYTYLTKNQPGEKTPEYEMREPADPPPPKTKKERDKIASEKARDRDIPLSDAAKDFVDDPVDGGRDLFNDAPSKPEATTRFDQAVARIKARDKQNLEREWSFAELCDEWVYITQMDRFVCEASPSLVLKSEQFDKRFAYTKPQIKNGPKTVSGVMFSKVRGTIRKPMTAVFLPGEAPGMLHHGHDYNLYRPSEIVAAQGDTEFWDDHLKYLWPEQADRDLVLDWCGWLLQNIALKPKHALLLAGYVHGTGKSFIGDVLTQILGDYNVTPVGSHELSSTFNKWALSSKLLKIEELDDVEKNIVKHTLHPIITQEELTINDKGISTFKSRNCFGIFAMTNTDAAIRLSSQDRRYLVVRTHAEPRSKDYYSDLYSILDDTKALAAIAYQLLHRSLGEYNAQSRAPDTAAKAEMVDAGRSDLENWMMDSAGIWPLNGRIIAIDDVIAQLPSRLERMQRLQGQITSIIKHNFRGIALGQTKLPGGERVSLWIINGAKIPRIEGALGAIYTKDKASRGVTAKDNGVAAEFSE